MSKTRNETRVPLPYLPQNITEEIFHKLSYNAIARSKLVCKEWNSIISSPKFMDDYFNYRRLTEGNHLIVLDLNRREWKWKSSIYNSSYSDLLKEQFSLSSVTLPVKDIPSWTRPRILGSYNGLVAISFDEESILWNPLTKRHSSISMTVDDDPRRGGSRLLYGLCYDGGRDEYSVVIVSSFQSPPVSPSNFNEETYEEIYVYLYNFNFKDGRRTRLNNRDSFGKRLLGYGGQIGKVVYGLPHWVVEFYDFIDPFAKKEILYFDLEDEKFKQMPRPNDNDYGADKMLLGLAAIDDENQLGCVLHDNVNSSLEIWVMKEYGNSESWTKLFTIPYLNVTVDHGSIQHIDVMGFMPNGELLLYLNRRGLWIYDFQKGNRGEIEFKDINFYDVITYQPRLIFPPSL